MGKATLEAQTLKILREIIREGEIKSDTVLLGRKGVLDSLSAIQLVHRIKTEFKIDLMEQDLSLESLSSVKNLVQFLENNL